MGLSTALLLIICVCVSMLASDVEQQYLGSAAVSIAVDVCLYGM